MNQRYPDIPNETTKRPRWGNARNPSSVLKARIRDASGRHGDPFAQRAAPANPVANPAPVTRPAAPVREKFLEMVQDPNWVS